MLTSSKFQFDKNDLVAVVKNAVLVGVAAALTYVGESVAKVDLGTAGPLLVPVVTLALDSFVKWVRNNVK